MGPRAGAGKCKGIHGGVGGYGLRGVVKGLGWPPLVLVLQTARGEGKDRIGQDWTGWTFRLVF